MPESTSFLESLVLNEVEGKNRAIHAYDGIVWKIRTGFLTLLFGGWAILLKGMVEKVPDRNSLGPLLWGLFLFSGGFAIGSWYVDRAPAQRVGHLDVVTILPGQAQRITNPGPSDLIFLCVCTPRFRSEAYLNLEG